MNKNLVATSALVALASPGLAWWGNTNDVPAYSQLDVNTKSTLSASERTYDFGVISMKNGNVEHIFKVANPTDKDIMIDRLSTSCMCTIAYIIEGASRTGPFGMPGMGYGSRANKLFKAGDTMNIEVVFDPNAHGPAGVGPMERSVHLTDTSGGMLQLEIRALVRP